MIELINLKTVSTSISFCFVKAIVILIHNYSNYNLEQNKMEQQPPVPPNSRMKPCKAKTLHFPILDLGAGRGGEGTNFLSILSKIVARLVLRNLTCTSPFCKQFFSAFFAGMNLLYIRHGF